MADKRGWTHAGLVLVQRRRRWTNTRPAFGEGSCLVFVRPLFYICFCLSTTHAMWSHLQQNETNGVLGHLCTYRLNWTRRTSWGWWDEWDDTALQTQIRARARLLSATEAPHNIESLRVSGGETFCFFETWRPEWGSNPGSPTFQAGSFNHCTRAPALHYAIPSCNKSYSRLCSVK